MQWSPIELEMRGYNALELDDPKLQAAELLGGFSSAVNTNSNRRPNLAQRALLAGGAGYGASIDYFKSVGNSVILGDDKAAAKNLQDARDAEEYASGLRQAAGVKDFKDLVSAGDASDWAKYFFFTGLETAPHIAGTMATAGSGAVAGLAAKGLKSFIKRKAKNIAKDRYVRNSALLSGFAHEYAAGTGEIYGFSGDENLSLAFGVPYAGLNFFSQLGIASAVLKEAKGTALEGQAKGFFRSVAEAGAKGAALEGATEELQTEIQLLAKSIADPTFDWAGIDANMMRLESLVAGSVLGGSISATGTGVTKPIGDFASSQAEKFRQGAADAQQQFDEGARQAERDFLPETEAQLITQLDELEAGRGREAVQVTAGPLPEAELETRGLQQVPLDNEQGVLVVRKDQDPAEVKAAFESGSRDVLGNGTVNKPEGGTQVVRAVNADGSRGADVVTTPEVDAEVTAAQEAKSDIDQTETVSAEQAIQERLAERDGVQVSNYTDEEIAAELQSQGAGKTGIDYEARAEMGDASDVPYVDYKSGLFTSADKDPYQSREAAENAAKERLIPMRERTEAALLGRDLTEDEKASIQDSIQVAEVADGWVIREFDRDNPANAADRIVKIAQGTTNFKKGKKLNHVADINTRLVKFLRTGELSELPGEAQEAVSQVFGVETPDGQLRALDIKSVAEAGWRELEATGVTARTEQDRLNKGLTQGLGTLAQAGYKIRSEQVGDFDLTLSENKTYGRDGPNVVPFVEEPGPENSGLGRLTDEPEVSIEETFGSPEEKQAAEAQQRELRTPSLDQEELRSRSNQRQKYDSWNTIPAKAVGKNFKIPLGMKSTDLLARVANILGSALKLTNTNILILDSTTVRQILARGDQTDPIQRTRDDINPVMAKQLEALLEDGVLGRSITDPRLDYGIVFVNTEMLRSQFKNADGTFDNFALRAKTAFVLSHEIGHQYFENVITGLPEADRRALQNIAEQSSAWQYYNDRYNGNDTAEGKRTAVNEWFADRIAALSMDIIGKRANQGLEQPEFFNQPVDNAFMASSVNITGQTGPQMGLFQEVAREQREASDLVRDPNGVDIRRVRNVAREVAQKLRQIYDTWKARFVDKTGTGRAAADPVFNEWLRNVVRRQGENPVANYRERYMSQQNVEIIDPLPNPRRRMPDRQSGETPAARMNDFGDFQQFADDYNIPRNRIQFERTAKRFYEGGVSSMLGRLFFSAHEQLSVMGPAGARLANMLYKKSSTIGRDGFMNRSLLKFQLRSGTLSQYLPNDKERASQVLDDFGIWRENGADLNNIPATIRPYRVKLTNFFDSIAADMAEVNPDFQVRENYFMHLYDPEKLNNPDVQDRLVQALVINEAMGPEEANAAVQRLRGYLQAAAQHDDPTGVSAHSQEARAFGRITYAQLRETGALYDPMTAVLKYTREMTRAAEFHRMFGGTREITVTQEDGSNQRVEKHFADAKLRDTINELPAEMQAEAKHIVDGMLGRLGGKVNPEWSKAQSWLMTTQFMATLLFASLASLPDIMMPALRSREMSGLGQNVEQIARAFNSQDRADMFKFAEDMGTVNRDLIHEAITAGYGSEWMDPKARKVTDTFFKFIGLEHWTRFTRVVGTSMARDFLIKHATEPNQRSERYLTELGIDAPTIQAWIDADRNFSTPEGQRVQMAILRFVDEAMLRPNSAERPTYMSDPRFMIFGQLKGFYYSFGQKVVGGLYREMQSRRAAGESIPAAMTPMIIAGVALMPLAALALGIREELKYEDGQEPTARMSSPEYLFELVSRSGFLGPLEIPKSMFDAGDYGLPFWAAPLGPTVATGFDLVESDGFDALEELIPVYNQFN